jgi:hypothetical protein
MDSKQKAAWGTCGSIYRYETKSGTRWRITFRDANGKQSGRRGFRTRREAQRAREQLMGRVHGRQIIVSRESLAGWWQTWLTSRKPYLENGSWNDYRRHGEQRILPHLGHRKLTTITAPEVREWIVELAEAGDFKPKTLNNSLTALTVGAGAHAWSGLRVIPVVTYASDGASAALTSSSPPRPPSRGSNQASSCAYARSRK